MRVENINVVVNECFVSQVCVIKVGRIKEIFICSLKDMDE